MQRIALAVEDALNQGLQLMADWLGKESGGHVALYKDFGRPVIQGQKYDEGC